MLKRQNTQNKLSVIQNMYIILWCKQQICFSLLYLVFTEICQPIQTVSLLFQRRMDQGTQYI